MNDAKLNKACGVDNIPAKVLKSDASISVLHILLNVCFSTGKIPSQWGRYIINPIFKPATIDPREPLSYRVITLAPSMYKIYCSVLNNRLSTWSELTNKIEDEQNGFRKGRSTVEHISSYANIIETRQKRKFSTFCTFVDFKKAYYSISRNNLWSKLMTIDIKGKMMTAIKSLYSNVSSCVRINNYYTDGFDVSAGLRQGCCLSPIFFNLYVDDFAKTEKSS